MNTVNVLRSQKSFHWPVCPILSHCFSAPNSFCSTYCTTLGWQSTFCSRVSWRQNAGLEEGDGSCALLFASCWNPFCSLILEEQPLRNASSPLPVLSWSSSWIHLGFLPLHWWKYAHPATPATPVSGVWCPFAEARASNPLQNSLVFLPNQLDWALVYLKLNVIILTGQFYKFWHIIIKLSFQLKYKWLHHPKSNCAPL